jgi:cytidylate kinase
MSNHEPIALAGIRNITISGRIGAGATTLAKKLSDVLNWPLLEGGDLFEKIHKQLNISQVDDKQQIIQSHLAGFDIQGISGVYKILVICQDLSGEDKADIRIDRLMNRDGISLSEAKHEALVREEENLTKFRKLYAHNDQSWIYWDPKYYDLIVNTYSLNREEALEFVLAKIGFAKS